MLGMIATDDDFENVMKYERSLQKSILHNFLMLKTLQKNSRNGFVLEKPVQFGEIIIGTATYTNQAHSQKYTIVLKSTTCNPINY